MTFFIYIPSAYLLVYAHFNIYIRNKSYIFENIRAIVLVMLFIFSYNKAMNEYADYSLHTAPDTHT